MLNYYFSIRIAVHFAERTYCISSNRSTHLFYTNWKLDPRQCDLNMKIYDISIYISKTFISKQIEQKMIVSWSKICWLIWRRQQSIVIIAIVNSIWKIGLWVTSLIYLWVFTNLYIKTKFLKSLRTSNIKEIACNA